MKPIIEKGLDFYKSKRRIWTVVQNEFYDTKSFGKQLAKIY